MDGARAQVTTWALDIECEKWDALVFGCAVSDSNGVVDVFESLDDLSRWYLALPAEDMVLAHAGGSYDFLALLEACRGRSLTWVVTMSGSRIVSARAKGHAEARDTYALFPMSLAVWTGAKEELALPCLCGEDCGGYCSVRHDMPDSQRSRLAEYCIADARALLLAWARDIERARALGIEILGRGDKVRRTIGGVAWATARDWCSLSREPLSWPRYRLERAAYHGGRSEALRTRAAAGRRCDINSAYPWSMTLPVPMGHGEILVGAAARQACVAEKPGLYGGMVDSDDDPAPLPRRARYDRLVWARGRGRGWWPGPELWESGARVEVDRAVVFQEERPALAGYVGPLWTARAAAKARGDAAWAKWLKWLMNSLSGKLAQGTEISLVTITDHPAEGWDWLGGDVWSKTINRVPESARPAWAAYVTGRVRVRVLAALRAGGWYADTDSCYGDASLEFGDALGAWGLEGSFDSWRACAPKSYAYQSEGDWTVHLKGVTARGLADYDAWEAGETLVNSSGVLTLREAAANPRGLFTRRIRGHARRGPPQLVGLRLSESGGETTAPVLHGSTISWERAVPGADRIATTLGFELDTGARAG